MSNTNDLPKITQEELVNTQATVAQAVTETGRDAAFVGKAIRLADLQAVASVKTNKPGRPPRVFNRAELFAAVEAAEQAETEQAAAKAFQTNTESTDADSDTQVA
jgi:hypothetical protein